MSISNIEVVFKSVGISIHELTMNDKKFNRLILPSTVALILHDPINDYLALREEESLFSLTTIVTIPQFEYDGLEEGIVAARRACRENGVTLKSVAYVHSLISDYKSTNKQVCIMYVNVDSRSINEDVFVKSSGSAVIRSVDTFRPIDSILGLSAYHLKSLRK